MRYLALATDYDGTLAHDGRVDEATVAAMERLLASGRKLILVTGRELDDLQTVFPHLRLFEQVVAENGALLYHPATRGALMLADPPPAEFVRELRRRGGQPLAQGRAIVATWEPHQTTVLELIREMGLGFQVIFNKGAVMVLPAGVTKATGLMAALDQLELSPHNVVAIGDAENDYPFLQACECGVAVANALPRVREAADFTTRGDHGAGAVELIDEILRDDLAHRDSALRRPHVPIGTTSDALLGGRAPDSTV
jgi:hydroxymethylpyrimidine pyrophosphatase-like HAD family hydrolase